MFLHQGDFLASVDFKNAYLHVSLSSITTFPMFCCGALTLPVYGPALWSLVCTLGVHQSVRLTLWHFHRRVLNYLLLREESVWAVWDNIALTVQTFIVVRLDAEPLENVPGINTSFGVSGSGSGHCFGHQKFLLWKKHDTLGSNSSSAVWE